MSSVFFTAEVVLVWLSSLFNGTGIGNTYHTDRITITVLVLAAAILLVKNRQTQVPRDIFLTFGGMTVIFTFSALFHGYGVSGLQYLCCFLLVYIFSQIPFREHYMRLAGLAILALGSAILVIYNFGTALSGWNGNSIAMIGLFSYIIFVAAFYNMRSWRAKFLILLAGAAILWLTVVTDSRSCMLLIVVTMAFALLMKPCPRMLRSRGSVKFLLLIPLVVAVITILLSLSGAAATLDVWSQEAFEKPIFNGRDTIWLDGLLDLLRHPLFGSGNISANSWHNTAIACLTSFGVLGYLFWLNSLYTVLKRGGNYLSDPIVTGCMMAFLLMNAQQSVELGMFALNPNLLVYLPLGLMLGRIRYLQGSEIR